MPDWEERITRETRPSIRVEHDLRYALAAPLISRSALWADLGCGSGVAAAAALDGALSGRAVLVDLDAESAESARREIGAASTETITADLSSADAVGRVRSALLDGAPPGPRAVTCFETIEHLANFVPLIELLTDLAEHHGFTAVISVPNDAFWSIENPYHQTMWGDGAFEELRRLLPEPVTVVRQVPLTGSALVIEGDTQQLPMPPVTGLANRVASHLIAGFGPDASRLEPRASAYAADLDEQRRWERQRESDLAVLQAEVAKLEGWMVYHRELERRLDDANARIAVMQGRQSTDT